MRIIPAIDIINGKCVRLTKGDYTTEKVYNENPLEVALEFESLGIKYLHLVDLDGARSKEVVNYRILNEISSKTKLKIDFGGGIKSENDLIKVFECGASQVTVGSIAVQNSSMVESWIEKYGSDKIILGADVKERNIATLGWNEISSIDISTFLEQWTNKGIQYVICTDISKDGMLQGPSTELYQEILSKFNVKLIASGGITSIDDLKKLENIGCEGAIIGKAIYEGKITKKELQELC